MPLAFYKHKITAFVTSALYAVEYAYARHKHDKSGTSAAYKRQRQARRRNTARNDRDVYHYLYRYYRGYTRTKQRAEPVGCAQRYFKRAAYYKQICAQHDHAPEQSELLAYYAEYKVAFGKRQKQIFLSRIEQAHAEKSASAQSLAFDRETMVERIFAGHGEAAALPIHPNSSLYDAGVATQALWNKEEAVRLLENAGWRLEEDGIRENRRSRLALKLIVNQENTAKAALADALAESLQRLGCDVTVDKLPWEDFSAALNRGSFDLYLGETVLTADFDLEDLLRTRGALNYGGCADGELDAWMDAYRAAAGEERQAAASTLWEQVTQVAPMVPLVFKNGSLLTQWGQVRGMAPTQRDVFAGMENWTVSGHS